MHAGFLQQATFVWPPAAVTPSCLVTTSPSRFVGDAELLDTARGNARPLLGDTVLAQPMIYLINVFADLSALL